jgi:hypothetical protein
MNIPVKVCSKEQSNQLTFIVMNLSASSSRVSFFSVLGFLDGGIESFEDIVATVIKFNDAP